MQSDHLSHGIRILLVLFALLALLTGCQGGSTGGGTGSAPGGTARVHIQVGSGPAAQPGTAGSSTGIRRQRVGGIPPDVTTITLRVTMNGLDIPNSPFNIPLETGAISVVITANVEHLFAVEARNRGGNRIFYGEASANFRAGVETDLPIALIAQEILRLVATQMVSASSGGEVVVTDPQSAVHGLRLLIPPAALARDTTLMILEANNPQNVPVLLSQAGVIVDILPDGLLFAVPATLTLPYNATLANDLNFDESALRVWRYNTVAGQWAPVPDQAVDTGSDVIRAQLTSLSFYTVAGPLPSSSTNRPPVADAQFVTTLENTPRALLLTGSDADNNPLLFRIVNNPQHGTVSGIPPALLYTPNPNFSGRDTLRFVVNDRQQDSVPATVTIEVTAVNNTPVGMTPLHDVYVDDTTTTTSTTLPLASILSDVDSASDADTWVFTVSHNTNPDLVATTTGESTLTLTYASRESRRNGAAVITVRATDQRGSFVETSLTVIVNRTYPFLIGESRLMDTTQRLTRPAN